jgi:hypothetical protein
MRRNVFIVLFTNIIVWNDAIELQISSIKHYGTDVVHLVLYLCAGDSHQDKARAKRWSYGNNNNSIQFSSFIYMLYNSQILPVTAKHKNNSTG